MNKSMKRWAIATLAAIIVILGACAATVAIVDPFQAYRKAEFYVPYMPNETQAYSNAGVVKHYAYDSAIVGTSMTENFRPSQLEEVFGGQFIKMCTSGGTAYNHALLMETGFRSHDIKRIVYGLDPYSFLNEVDETAGDVPLYLYDENILNDVEYLLTKDVLFTKIQETIDFQETTYLKPGEEDRDEMYFWGTLYEYSEEAVMKSVNMNAKIADMKLYDMYAEKTTANIEDNILSFVRAHPDTEFLIFFPPYSVIEWYQMYQIGNLDFVLYTKELATEMLLGYDNVKLYDFTACEEWVKDLSLYKDYSHYRPEINDAIAVAISQGEYLVDDIYDVYENNDLLNEWVDELKPEE